MLYHMYNMFTSKLKCTNACIWGCNIILGVVQHHSLPFLCTKCIIARQLYGPHEPQLKTFKHILKIRILKQYFFFIKCYLIKLSVMNFFNDYWVLTIHPRSNTSVQLNLCIFYIPLTRSNYASCNLYYVSYKLI